MGQSLRKYKESLSDRFTAINLICNEILSSNKPVSKVNFPKDIKTLNTLVSGDKASEAYKAKESNIIKGLTGALSEKFNLSATAAEWPKMPENEKRSLLKRILKVQASLQSTGEIRVKVPRLEVMEMNGCGSMGYDLDDLQGKKDRIIISEKVFNGDLSQTLNTLAHEQTHIFQVSLARAVASKQINQNNPLYRDGLYFLMKDKHQAYVSSAIEDPYMLQRDEVDAYNVGDKIGEFAARFEAKEEQEEEVTRRTSKKASQLAVPA